ncbi:MAG TPA: hypothetical protein VK507_06860, partial [Iamia sp.]|nr:hypothetical protein [Iamia sp.]
IVFAEFEEVIDPETVVGITFSGSLADDLVDPPTEIPIAEDEAWGEVSFEIDDFESGDLTITVEPGLGYVADPDDFSTVEVSDEIELVASCHDDLGTPPGGTDRQTIDVGERPVPIGFFEDVEEEPGGEPSTTIEVIATTASDPGEVSADFSRLRALRAAPEGYDTPVANGTLPPGLTYVDDEWTGAATTAGTYGFDVRVCFDQSSFIVEGEAATAAERALGRREVRAFPDEICFGYVDVQVVVRAVAPPPPPVVAPPATPVVAPAQFAG